MCLSLHPSTHMCDQVVKTEASTRTPTQSCTRFTCAQRSCPPGCKNDGTCFCTGGGAQCDRHWNQCDGERCGNSNQCLSGVCSGYFCRGGSCTCPSVSMSVSMSVLMPVHTHTALRSLRSLTRSLDLPQNRKTVGSSRAVAPSLTHSATTKKAVALETAQLMCCVGGSSTRSPTAARVPTTRVPMTRAPTTRMPMTRVPMTRAPLPPRARTGTPTTAAALLQWSTKRLGGQGERKADPPSMGMRRDTWHRHALRHTSHRDESDFVETVRQGLQLPT